MNKVLTSLLLSATVCANADTMGAPVITGISAAGISPGVSNTKWFPGVYQEVKSPAQKNGNTLWNKAPYTTVLDMPNVKGYMFVVTWKELETAPGKYDFSLVKTVLDYLNTKGKKMQLVVMDRSFAGDILGNLPQHIVDAGCKFVTDPALDTVGHVAMGKRGTFKWYLPKCVDKIVALYKELGRQFDTHPALSVVSVGYLETALDQASIQKDFTSGDILAAQQLRATVDVKPAFPHTLVGMGYNWAPNLDTIAQTFANGHGFMIIHPDTVPGVYVGKNGSATKNEIKYRGVVPTLAKAEQTFIKADMPNKEQQQWDWAFKTIGATMFTFGDGASYSTNYLVTNVIPFLKTNPVIPAENLKCPKTAEPCSTGVVTSKLETKWYPGHYQTIQSLAYSKGVWNYTKPHNKAALEHPKMTGYLLMINWRELEKARGAYDFSQIDAYLDVVGKAGKKLQVKIQDRAFQNEPGGNAPDYVSQLGCMYPMPDQKTTDPKDIKGLALKWYKVACTDMFIDLYKALGKRYDSDKRLAAITIGDGESALSGAPQTSDYTSPTLHIDQIIRAAKEVKTAFPTTLTLTGLNMLPDAKQFYRIGDALIGIGGSGFIHPDTVPGKYYGGTDEEIRVRGKVAVWPQFQQPQIPVNMPEAERKVFEWAMNTIGANSVSWGAGYQGPGNYITLRVLPFLSGPFSNIPAKNLECPTSLGKCIN